MYAIGKTLVSDELFTEHFCCDLAQCGGCCCVEGDAGAPLDENELPLLEKYAPVFKKYMTVEGLLTIAADGLWSTQEKQTGIADTGSVRNKHYVTPIINGRDCAYLYKDTDGISKCAIEKAYIEKEITDFQKPVSCHLFPVRIDEHENYDAVNYFRWNICYSAVLLGDAEKIPVFRFLKEPLIRKYGEKWYEQAEDIYAILST
ncbi:MAG: DUF3109 family protein [Bacteroidales bacterium]|jgi:hypothetical protein|nr:DUF3109 family protein [Bacteroidales bacterium]